ncbi:prolyl aminopeptidase [Defluviicoccus vanus]|uniref:Proline iminopeptidase n=1 Tax=Defluviicoccus vanus TaxID=111831 RepID=A0A7H1N435_9PROT|nr:prolyl aminopeptidase [Defluviicoccus vanus]QNT70471.1 prolyl aminopeptidase [Defluviicoccus vanus]
MDVRHVRHDLFPEIEPFASGLLAVDSHHTIYWEQSGNPRGIPVIFLHGGPGAGAAPAHRRFFDPHAYRVVIFDQRGCGRSHPHGEVRDNSTQHLVEDMETLRDHLGIKRWMLFGGSWGSTLALAYGIRHPRRCTGLVLRGIFLGGRSEIDWFLYGMRTFFPEAWRHFAESIPVAEHGDLLTAYHRRLLDADPAVHLPAAHTWSRYETVCSSLIQRADDPLAGSHDEAALALARIEAHYFVNNAFLADDEILHGVSTLRHLVPGTIVQGRYDMVCPIVTADRLAHAWPEARYVIVADAGHSAMEPGIRAALVRATEAMKVRLA